MFATIVMAKNDLPGSRVPQKTAVICRLSCSPTISTLFLPLVSMVQGEEGTKLIAVWSQFMINCENIFSIVTTSTILKMML